MEIKWVEMENFKGFNSPVRFDLFKKSLIHGQNGQGKSSIAEAITFALYGKSLMGESRIDDISHVKAKKNAKTRVTICFVESETYKTFEVCRIKSGAKQEITVNGNPSTQQSIDALLVDSSIFLSIFNPRFFTDVLDNNEKREIIDLITEKVDYEEFFIEEAGDLSLLETYDFDLYGKDEYKKVKKKIEEFNNNLIAMRTEVDVLFKENLGIANEKIQDIDTKKEEDLKLKVEASKKYIDTKNELLQKVKVSKESSEKIFDLEKELSNIPKVEEDSSDPTTEIETLTNRKTKRIAELNEDLFKLKNEIVSVSSIPQKIDDGIARCPTCYQEVDEKYKDKVNAAIDQKVLNIEKNNLETLDKINKINKDISEIELAFNKKCSEIQNKATIYRNNLSRLNEIKNNIEFFKKQLFFPSPNEEKILAFDNSKLVSDYESIVNYNRELKATNEIALDRKNRKALNQKRIDQLNLDIVEVSKMISDLDRIYKGLHPSYLLRKSVQKQIEEVEDHLSQVSICLLKENKSGGIANVFDILYNDKPYRRISYAESILCSLEISLMINKISGKHIPIFIDNAESITMDLPYKDLAEYQTIKAKVVENQPLDIVEEV